MNPRPFLLERYFARYEFSTPFLLASSDCEPLTLAELLALATPSSREAFENLRLGYTESAGLPALREHIAALYPGLGPANILTAAPQELIYLLARTLLRRGDRVIATFPGYQSLYEIAATLGCDVLRWTPEETPQGWRFDIRRAEELAAEGCRAFIVNFPHNPTGATLSPEDWDRLVALAARSNAWLISDEMYRGLEPGPALAPAACASPLGISLAGLSKAYGLAGLRTGWLATRSVAILDAVQQYKDYTTICSAAPAEQLALIALENHQALLARCRELLAANRRHLDAFMADHTHFFAWRPPAAGPVAFPRLLAGSADSFCEVLARQAGVMLLPSSVYEWGDFHLRLGFGRRNLPQALDALRLFLAHPELPDAHLL